MLGHVLVADETLAYESSWMTKDGCVYEKKELEDHYLFRTMYELGTENLPSMAYHQIGVMFERNKEYEKALAMFDEAIKICPIDPEAWEHKVSVLRDLVRSGLRRQEDVEECKKDAIRHGHQFNELDNVARLLRNW